MFLQNRYLPSTANISLHHKQHKLRAMNVQLNRLDRRTQLLATCSAPTKAAKVVTSESRAQAVFAEHLKMQGSTDATEEATCLLQQAALSKNVPPYVILGAALHIEQQCHSLTGVIQRQPYIQY